MGTLEGTDALHPSDPPEQGSCAMQIAPESSQIILTITKSNFVLMFPIHRNFGFRNSQDHQTAEQPFLLLDCIPHGGNVEQKGRCLFWLPRKSYESGSVGEMIRNAIGAIKIFWGQMCCRLRQRFVRLWLLPPFWCQFHGVAVFRASIQKFLIMHLTTWSTQNSNKVSSILMSARPRNGKRKGADFKAPSRNLGHERSEKRDAKKSRWIGGSRWTALQRYWKTQERLSELLHSISGWYD